MSIPQIAVMVAPGDDAAMKVAQQLQNDPKLANALVGFATEMGG